MTVMQDEIFGPVLPVKTYDKVEEAVDYINGCDRPLGTLQFRDRHGQERTWC